MGMTLRRCPTSILPVTWLSGDQHDQFATVHISSAVFLGYCVENRQPDVCFHRDMLLAVLPITYTPHQEM